MIKFYFCGLFLTLISVIVTNYVVDPYDAFNSKIKIEINRPFKIKKEVEYKLALAKSANYTGVIIGTSRVRYGIDPKKIKGGNYINLGTGGQSYYITKKMYEASKSKANKIIVALDFFPSNAYYSGNNNQPIDYLSLLFSIQTFKDSIFTPFSNNKNNEIDDFGYQINFTNDNHRLDSDNSDKNFLVKLYLNRPECDFKKTNNLYSPVEEIYNILDDAYSLNKEVIIFIPPIHARHQYLIYETGLQMEYYRWLLSISHKNSILAHKYKKNEYVIWDFSYINSFTQDPIPNYNNDFKMKYYLETSHFNNLLGDQIMCRLNNYCDINGFGNKINKINLEKYMIDNTASLIRWANVNKLDANYIKKLVADYKYKGCINSYDKN